MELGQRLRQARLEKGLSQKELCGDFITRNMLSQIENGSARPSMDTLRYLSERLGKPMGYFLEEDPLEQARQGYAQGHYTQTLTLLEGQKGQEAGLLRRLCLLELAQQAMEQERLPYARQLLEQAEGEGAYDFLTARELALLKAQASNQPLNLPADDRELLLRARDALAQEQPGRAGAYLDAAEHPEAPRWNYLRGQAYFNQGSYDLAKECFLRAEPEYPRQCAEYLEQCCEALEDFKGAYYYAKKAK